MEIQTRSYDGVLRYFTTFKEALSFSRDEKNEVWKISFDIPTGERIRLVLREGLFVLEQMPDIAAMKVLAAMSEE